MKPWQHGYDIDYLKGLEAQYADYNAYTLSPFAKYKKNNIAESLKKGNLIFSEFGLEPSMFEVTNSKVASDITMHGDTVIATKVKGDVSIGKLSGNINTIKHQISLLSGNNFWLTVWAENKAHCDLAEELGFCYVGPKITTYGEVHAIYFKSNSPIPRSFPKVESTEYLSIKKIGTITPDFIESVSAKLATLPAFTNHYSNYNKDKAWSALSLRGYRPESDFITKPSEMSDEWKEKNKDVKFELQDTPLYDMFPEVRELLSKYKEVHRVRFMQLKPGGGELERHTDQVDKDSGGSKGKLARLHIPIITNPNMIFTVWNTKGTPQKIHMEVGDLWFLDTRKPHQAINNGTDNRIHLVIDAISEGDLYESLVS